MKKIHKHNFTWSKLKEKISILGHFKCPFCKYWHLFRIKLSSQSSNCHPTQWQLYRSCYQSQWESFRSYFHIWWQSYRSSHHIWWHSYMCIHPRQISQSIRVLHQLSPPASESHSLAVITVSDSHTWSSITVSDSQTDPVIAVRDSCTEAVITVGDSR